ncbi:alpha-glucosidase/alpha-galactosidase [Paenibacillus xerothermodurans]|uniref:Alpha-glucosidase/alpha-galactosidase n=1 Tax=Paenibacillus xerothermodurans TaxID=1977292 RepID=A0A2W1NI52_PAEXE|nr:alpha-glucosidase/alpha-galactosidase [Paenibacillus xerothermodurans]PZE22841.1 alpha-glucosidase/alpha-galactosidase [Paenibacillus xerothermodurans]
MLKIAMIGAGSVGFTRRLMMDLLAVPEFQDTEFRLMDINEENLEMIANLCTAMIHTNGLAATVIPTTVQREAVKDADYVFCMARVGGLEAFQHDVEIPLRYGVDQCVGDTLGPGGVFFGLRTIPVLLDLAKDMRELAPNALLLNYSNPMAMNTWALRRAGGIKVVGLCHGVQGGHKQIATALGLPQEEMDFICAGINHQTWYIQVTHKGNDMLPYLLEAFERHPALSKSEPCRIDVLRRFGYYSTESNGHLSEYLPWYRKRKEEIDKWIYPDVWIGGSTAGYLNHCKDKTEEYREMYPKWLNGEAEYIRLGERSNEHGSYIIEALETGRTYRGHFNVENRGNISNLPDGCTIEIPGYVDANGISMTVIGDLPLQCAATCRASISVQEMAVHAALTGDRELVKLAVLHDPLTAAVCSTDEVWSMCDEMFEALAQWMPQFNGEGRRWSDIPQPDGGNYRFARSKRHHSLPTYTEGYNNQQPDERLIVGHSDN